MTMPHFTVDFPASLRPTFKVVYQVAAERERQDEKWGPQNHNPFTWLAILGEEVGEANQAALQATFGGMAWADYRKELIEVAAVAVAMVECLDRNGGQPPADIKGEQDGHSTNHADGD